MSFNFVIPEFNINGAGTPPLQFFRKGFNLGGTGETPSWQDIVLSGNGSLTLTNALAHGLNYLKLFGGTEQRNLPAGYTQVNYVTNTAQTMINTGVKFDFSKNYEIELKASGVTGSWYILQARESASAPISGISGSSTGNVIGVNFNGTYVASSQISRVFGHIYYVKGTINNGNMTLYIKDETAGTEETVTGTYTPITGQSVDIGLFGNVAGNYVAINSDIYFVRIKENDTVVMDYVPCRQSATAGFYDKVSGTFKTASNLVADGNTVPSPDTPMDIVSNNGTIKARHQSGLPLGYTLLEYIESTGTQYIDPQVSGNARWVITAQTTTIKGSSQSLISSTSGASGGTWYGEFTNTGHWDIISGGTDIPSTTKTTADLTFDSKGARGTIGSTSVNRSASVTQGTWRFFITTGGSYPFAGKLFDVKVYQNNVLVRNFVPAKNSSNVVGLYDLVSGQFFTNDGTGTLTAGDPVSDPVEIYTDGTTETIQVTGKNLFNVNNMEIQESTAISSDGSLVSNTSVNTCITYISVKPNTTYTISGNVLGSSTAFFRLAQYKADKTFISRSEDSTGERSSYTFTTGANTYYIRFHYVKSATLNTYQLELGSTATTYEPYYNGGSATAEMLLKVGTYQDVQSVLDGGVTRNVGVKVLDGTEDIGKSGVYVGSFFIRNVVSNWGTSNNAPVYCTHFNSETSESNYSIGDCIILNKAFNMWWASNNTPTIAQFAQWLADQYNSGNPVVVVYPLATATTESVESQALTIQAGSNLVEITQASIDNLGLEVSYKGTV